jgi:hypothetical protein
MKIKTLPWMRAKNANGHSRASAMPVIDIDITAGSQAGSSAHALTLPISIGSGRDCQVVLTDAGLKPTHLQLTGDGNDVVVAAREGAVAIAGAGILSVGRGRRTSLPVHIRIGQAELRIARHGDRALSTGGRPHWPVVASFAVAATRRRCLAALAAIAVLGAILGPGALRALGHRTDAARTTTPVHRQAPISMEDRSDRTPALGYLREILGAHALPGLDVTQEHSTLVVTGTLPKDAHPRWRDVRRQFDAQYGASLLIRESFTPDAILTPPALSVGAVKVGQQGHIVDTSGKRHYPGASLSGGWVLARLEQDAVILRHGQHEYRLMF